MAYLRLQESIKNVQKGGYPPAFAWVGGFEAGISGLDRGCNYFLDRGFFCSVILGSCKDLVFAH